MEADLRQTGYKQLPEEAAKPKMWKSLGWVCSSLEATYHLETFAGDLDVDREAELREEMTGMLPMLVRYDVDVANTVFVRYARGGIRQVYVRFIGGHAWLSLMTKQ